MAPECVHSCKGLCTALSVAEHREEEALKEYRRFAAECDYPEVGEVLAGLIAERERGLRILREKRAELAEKFDVIDRINDSFA
jgi:rubrerythrin